MKTLNKMPVIFLVAGYYFIKMADIVFHPLKDIPVPDFNNEYDPTML
jgi:hypothetical protein